MQLGGLKVAVDTILPPGWFRARGAGDEPRCELLEFGDTAIPYWAIAVDLAREDYDAVCQTFRPDDAGDWPVPMTAAVAEKQNQQIDDIAGLARRLR
jgi:hypothetical protein